MVKQLYLFFFRIAFLNDKEILQYKSVAETCMFQKSFVKNICNKFIFNKSNRTRQHVNVMLKLTDICDFYVIETSVIN